MPKRNVHVEKIAAARVAVEKAAALLVEHAEGLVMLSRMEEQRCLTTAESVTLSRGLMLMPNPAADRAYLSLVRAAAMLAGKSERYVQAAEIWPSEQALALRDAVYAFTGDREGMPPSISSMPTAALEPELGITAERVHAQAWRDYLAARAEAGEAKLVRIR